MIEVIIKPDFWKYVELVLSFATVCGAVFFGIKQYDINKRLKDLQDYVAVFIAPINNTKLRITNVGKANLYIHKWELGALTETFEEPVLIPVGGGVIEIGLLGLSNGEHDFKVYIADEKSDKYVSNGKVFKDTTIVSPQNPPSVIGEVQMETDDQLQSIAHCNVRAYSYKTEKRDWNL